MPEGHDSSAFVTVAGVDLADISAFSWKRQVRNNNCMHFNEVQAANTPKTRFAFAAGAAPNALALPSSAHPHTRSI